MVKSHVSNLILLESYQAVDYLLHTQTENIAKLSLFGFYWDRMTLMWTD